VCGVPAASKWWDPRNPAQSTSIFPFVQFLPVRTAPRKNIPFLYIQIDLLPAGCLFNPMFFSSNPCHPILDLHLGEFLGVVEAYLWGAAAGKGLGREEVRCWARSKEKSSFGIRRGPGRRKETSPGFRTEPGSLVRILHARQTRSRRGRETLMQR
jgi:hypothetical protein